MQLQTYYIACTLLSLIILYGISLMSKVKTAVKGNLLNSIATALAIIVALIYFEIFPQKAVLYIIILCMAIGIIIGLYLTKKVRMIEMPQLVAFLNGIGGAASLIVGGCTLFVTNSKFELATAIIALIIGTMTFTGSLIAAAKLSNLISVRPVTWKFHQVLIGISIISILVIIALFIIVNNLPILLLLLIATILSGFLGVAIVIRVGGADMPITISLLNSFSGVAGSICGMAIGDILLVSVGGIVGASGLILTQIMCESMNSSLLKILQGKTTTKTSEEKLSISENDKYKNQNGSIENESIENKSIENDSTKKELKASEVLSKAKKVIIVPGYGMALAQAQHLVKQLSDTLESNGSEVKFAIHPVAGRMPGHMNVLLCEVDVDYDQLYEMDDINDEFSSCDVCIVVGANDVLNPAARDAVDTPIYGMPILNVDRAKHIIFCNYDLKPGYAGIDNPLYKRTEDVSLLLGDASETLQNLLNELNEELKCQYKAAM